jgi:hypothetical protein
MLHRVQQGPCFLMMRINEECFSRPECLEKCILHDIILVRPLDSKAKAAEDMSDGNVDRLLVAKRQTSAEAAILTVRLRPQSLLLGRPFSSRVAHGTTVWDIPLYTSVVKPTLGAGKSPRSRKKLEDSRTVRIRVQPFHGPSARCRNQGGHVGGCQLA